MVVMKCPSVENTVLSNAVRQGSRRAGTRRGIRGGCVGRIVCGEGYLSSPNAELVSSASYTRKSSCSDMLEPATKRGLRWARSFRAYHWNDNLLSRIRHGGTRTVMFEASQEVKDWQLASGGGREEYHHKCSPL
jgi:hypothetical protein